MKRLFSGARRIIDRVHSRKGPLRRWFVHLCVELPLGVPLIFTACAHISFHDPANPTHDVGLEYYKPKLYLLVAKTKDGTKAEILTLPDLTQPRYALLHPGYGSSTLTLKLNNGVLTDVGQTVDTKIPETITALSSLATAAAGPKAPVSGATEEGEPYFRLYEMIIRDGQVTLKEVRMISKS